ASGAPALEITLLGPRLRFDADAVIALTGAEFTARIDGLDMRSWRPQRIAAGAVLDIGAARRGARGYLAVAGGFMADPVLGSMSTDVNARIGPFGGRALKAGDTLMLSAGAATPRASSSPQNTPMPAWSLDPRPWFDPDPSHPIRLIRGAHFDMLDAPSRDALFGAGFRVAVDSNRVGFRFDGPRLALAAALEPVSEPVASGTLQLPPDGQAIALMAEHPTIGGYPRIGQIAAIDLPRLAQRRPGESVCFGEIGLDEAQTRYLARERELARLFDTIATRLAGHD
ncbi:MAG: biotin-dependent carboxyltransferase family protein, partial [Lysobacterales bacterium]